MKSNRFAGLLLGTAAFVLAGCNVQSNAGSKPADNAAAAAAPAAPAAPAPAPAAPAAEGGGAPSADVQGAARQNFTIVNNTGHTVVTLNVSASNENSWGADILGRDTLGNGETAQITFPHDTAQCSFDIRATYDDGDTTDMRGVNLCTVATVTLTP
jgi:hypothetical protein